jgi:putative restriction endonuclease
LSYLEALPYYLAKFNKLRVDRTHGAPAPHKPILILSILQAISLKQIRSPKVYLTPELISIFKANWSHLVVSTKHHCAISYPFFYMKSEGFWRLVPNDSVYNLESLGSTIKSTYKLSLAIAYAEMDENLFLLAKDPHINQVLTNSILDFYFSGRATSLEMNLSYQQELFGVLEHKILMDSPETYKMEMEQIIESKDEDELFLRGSFFKREVPRIYNFTCSISELRISSMSNITLIDACHIVPFSQSRNDTISNGIALCPNLHRAFDRGLISIDAEYKVLVSDSFKESGTNYSLKALKRKPLQLPQQKAYWPSQENLDWHRNHVFLQ